MRTLNDNNNHEHAPGACSTMVRQRFVVQAYAKAYSQANGNEKRAASK